MKRTSNRQYNGPLADTANTSRTRAASDADPDSLARLREQEVIAARAGISLPPPIYALGTPVVALGRDNFVAKRTAWESLPAFPDVCIDGIDRIVAEGRDDVPVRMGDLSMRPDGAVRCAPPDTAAAGTVWQFTPEGLQTTLRLLGPQAASGVSYLEQCPPALRSTNFNHWTAVCRAAKDDPSRILRTRKVAPPADGEPAPLAAREIYAAVSERYGTLDADAIAKVAARLVPAGARGELLYDGVRFRLTASWFSSVQPDKVCAGEVFRQHLIVSTRDDGLGSITVRWGFHRNLCLNLIVIGKGQATISVRHTGALALVEQNFQRALGTAAEACGHFARKWTAAREENLLEALSLSKWAVSETRQLFAGLVDLGYVAGTGLQKRVLVDRLVDAWKAEPGYTRADVVNAITRTAHTAEWSSPWTSELVEERAGALLEQRVYWQPVYQAGANALEAWAA